MIDKMYVMFPNYKESEGKLEYTLSTGDSKEAVQNRVIELYKALILHQSNITKIMTSLDHEHVKQDAQNLAPAKDKSDLDNYEFIQDITTKYSFLAGLAGVGQEANTSSDYAMGTMSNVYLENVNLGVRSHQGESFTVQLVNSKGETYESSVPHTKFDRIKTVELSDNELKQWIDSYNKRTSKKLTFEEVQSYKSFAISDNISALMNAFVDIAKDPYITNVNWNMMTTNTGNMMLRAGVHPFITMSFLAQPIIKEYIDFLGQYETRDKTEQTSNSKDAFRLYKVGELVKDQIIHVSNYSDGTLAEINAKKLYEIVTKYNSGLEFLKEKDFIANNKLKLISKELGLPDNHKYTQQDLDRITQSVKDVVKKHQTFFTKESFNDYVINEPLGKLRENVFNYDVNFQARTFSTFLKFQGFAKKMKSSIDASKYSVNGMGKNTTQLLIAINRINNISQKGVINYETKEVNNDGSLKLLGYLKEYNLEATKRLVQSNPLLFVSSTPFVWNSYNQISQDIYGINLEDDSQGGLGDTLDKTFNTYLMSGFEPFNMSSEEKRMLIEEFPKTFLTFKSDYSKRYKILDELNIKKGAERNYIVSTNKSNSAEYTDAMMNSWRELIRIHPEFGNNLVKYSFVTSGFNNNTSSFFQFIPPSFFFQNNFNGYVKEFTKYPGVIDQNFINHFYLSNLNDSKYVKYVNKGLKLKEQPYSQHGVILFDQKVTKEFINVDNTFYKRIGTRYDSKGKVENLYSTHIKTAKGFSLIKSLTSEREGGISINNFNSKELSLPIDTKLSKETIAFLNELEQANFTNSITTEQSDDYNQEDNVEKEPLTDFTDVIPQEKTIETISDTPQLSLFDNLQESKTMSNLKQMFKDGLMLNKFNESGINTVEDLNTKSEDELGELLKKICK